MSLAARAGGATMIVIFLLLAVCWTDAAQKWSSELGDDSEWIPLDANPISKRQASARVLTLPGPAPFHSNFFPEPTFQDFIPQEGRPQYLRSVASDQQLFLNQPNTLNQQHPIQLTLRSRFNPQDFIPRVQDDQYNFRQSVQEQFQQPAAQNFNNQFYSNIPPSQASALPLAQTPKPFVKDIPKYVDGYKLENVSGTYLGSKNLDKSPLPNMREMLAEIAPTNNQQMTERSSYTRPQTTPSGTTVEKEEVQLLYVPLETLQNKKFDVKQFIKNSQKVNPLIDSVGSPVQFNNQLYAQTTPSYVNNRQQTQLHNIQQDLIQQALNTQNLQGTFQNQFQRQSKYQNPTLIPFSQAYPSPAITTPRSKKLKAHQPPLAVFMIHRGQGSPQLSDVLNVLKESKSISVLDTVIPNSPDVFVGPSNLKAPSKYAKFELPYLSSIDGNRIQRKVNQLPFFVAPLSYKAPEGFAKIPFPAPHVGSVIVNPFMKMPDVFQSSVFPSSQDYSTFPQFPTTESYRTTVRETIPTEESPFKLLPSSTPNPANAPGIRQSFIPLEQSPFNQFRPQQPEPTIISSSRPPQNSFFSTSARPSVSYFSFPEPEFSTLPTTKSPNPREYEQRGHYITSAAVENSPPQRYNTRGRDETTQTHTSPLPATLQTYQPQNSYNGNQFALRNPYEPTDFRTNIRGNEIRNYDTNNYRQPAPVSNQNSLHQFEQPAQKFHQFPSGQKVNPAFSTTNDFSPRPSVTETYTESITEKRPSPQVETSPDQYETFKTKQQTFRQYSSPVVRDEEIDTTSEIQYETEIPTTSAIITTTTTTTTTTVAPTTSKGPFRRRPIVSRGRPKYTTPKSDDIETTTVAARSTTRRVPVRERKPNTFRTKLESTRSTTTTTVDPSVDAMNSFEAAKKGSGKLATRQQFTRTRTQENDRTTTESPADKPTTARNTRLRMRGRNHYKASEGSDYVPKKKVVKSEEDNIAYQRDVLHQNYPVTISERRSTLEVHTTTAMPSSRTTNRDNIKIYETTSNAQRPYSVQDTASSEPPLVYKNEPIFQGEEERFVTKPELYVEINGKSPSAPSSEKYVFDRTTESILPSSSAKYEEEPQATEQNTEPIQTTLENVDISEEVEVLKVPATEIPIVPQVTVSEEQAPKFRNKIRVRPKLFSPQEISKKIDEDHASVPTKNVEEATEETFEYSKKPSSPSTYRPLFSHRRTTMKIEEIEEELKSKRKQVKPDSRSTTFKYPVYIPESTSAMSPSAEQNDFVSTTKRNSFVRRRPIRPTAPATAAAETTTESQVTSVKPTNKRIRVRGRMRARPSTTERPEISRTTFDDEQSQSFSSPDAVAATQRTPSQRFRGRQPTTRYFKKPLPSSDKNTADNEEDQASFDSINRPEFVQFSTASRTGAKADSSHWSPKLTSNSFRPVFSPNVIEDVIKTDNFDYGSKINSEEPDIITARSPYEDVLISVTPASNNLNEASSLTETRKEKSLVKGSDATSTFESVLEEVMRNLEEQDENEYNKDYVAVMKHEGGEIGEIPPETTAETEQAKLITRFNADTEIRKVSPHFEMPNASSLTTFQEFSDKLQETSTVRKPRRRGFWRKIRPANKELFETAESQFYKNTNNDLISHEGKSKGSKLEFKGEKTTAKSVEVTTHTTTIKQENTEPTTVLYIQQTESIETIETTISPEEKKEEDKETPGDVDMGTGAPDLLAMEMANKEIIVTTYKPRFIKPEVATKESEIENKTEYLVTENSSTDPSEKDIEDNTITTEPYSEMSTSLFNFMHSFMEQDIESEVKEANKTETTTLLEVADEVVTTVTPPVASEEIPTDKPIEKPSEEVKSFSEAMQDILAEVEKMETDSNLEQKEEKIVEEDTEKPQEEAKKDTIETTTAGFKFLDPMAMISTSMSTEISHETEICFRGKCVKTKSEPLDVNV